MKVHHISCSIKRGLKLIFYVIGCDTELVKKKILKGKKTGTHTQIDCYPTGLSDLSW